jgi:hypothetical protein
MFQDKQPEQVQQALAHLDSSIVDQEGAVEGLKKRAPGEAASGQQSSLDQMRKALEKLTEGQGENQDQQQQQKDQAQQQQQQQQQQDQQDQKKDQQQDQAQQQKRDETAKSILEEEKENREKRKQAASGYRKVDKDW